jgi:2-keto-3-deoxy-L-fuconate dehydrogenase
MSRELGEGLARAFGRSPSEVLEGAVQGTLQGRGQTAEEIAAAALFLCSDEASAITGQAINVDGGMSFC